MTAALTARPRPVGRPSNRDLVERVRTLEDALIDARMELDSRRFEERRMAREAGPLIARLHLIAHEHGPVAFQTVAALDVLLTRHGRRWTPGDAA